MKISRRRRKQVSEETRAIHEELDMLDNEFGYSTLRFPGQRISRSLNLIRTSLLAIENLLDIE